jgi:Tol biopolymer transport system component
VKYAKILITVLTVAAPSALATWYTVCAATFSPDGSKVAYLSNDICQGGISYAIYTISADGSDRVRLKLKGGLWGAPHFSPDGSKIAFIGDRECFPYGNVFLVNVDGTDLKAVTAYGDDPFEVDYNTGRKLGVLDAGLTFSPDGGRILYLSDEFGSSDIYAINVDGTGKTRLTDFAGCDEYKPIFLPGGELLFTVKGTWDKAGFWIMNADGSAQRRLATGEDLALVALSPDGTKRAYAGRFGEDYATYVADLDGSGRFKVADGGVYLSFSPDGEKLVYCDDDRVYIVNADGSGRRALTPEWPIAYGATFAAGGAKIIFLGRPAGAEEIGLYTMNADGSERTPFRATKDMYVGGPVDIFGSCCGLVVSPAGDRFLFNGDYKDYVGDAPVDYFAVNVDGSGLARISEYNYKTNPRPEEEVTPYGGDRAESVTPDPSQTTKVHCPDR